MRQYLNTDGSVIAIGDPDDGQLDDYQRFIEGKHIRADLTGFTAGDRMPERAFEWQKRIIRWACLRGRAALFLDVGLGKTICQLAWADQVVRYAKGDVLILCPLAVAKQTQREGIKFGIATTVCRKQADVRPGINIANYEMLSHFDPSKFVGIVLDEASILKNFTGATKELIIASFRDTPYKLECSATPAPNDHLELGNHAEFLGVMPSNEMISRWFINDTMKAGGYRLKGHAAKDFWKWVASWAVSIKKPSDIGGSDEGYNLPELRIHEIIVDVDVREGAAEGFLFREAALTATTMHKELKRTVQARANAVNRILEANGAGPWLIWCHTNYESDALKEYVKGATEIRGDDKMERKEQAAMDFVDGKIERFVSKPKIFGSGLNFQACHKMIFTGLNFSWESMYQAIGRCWRFGQNMPVDCYIVRATTEGEIIRKIREKEAAHQVMQVAMVEAMREETMKQIGVKRKLRIDAGGMEMVLPNWLTRKEMDR
jgi:hypothetical protein